MVKPFLQELASQMIAKGNMEKLTIVLPSKRSIVFLKHYLAQEIEQPVWLPRIYSIEDFITELSGLNTLDNLSLQFRLYDVFDTNRPDDNDDTFEQFLKWSQTVLYDFNEMDRYLVDPKRLLTNLRDIKELEQWSLNSAELTPFQEKYVTFFGYLYEWYEVFTQSLKADNLAYQGLAYRHAAEQIIDIKHDFDEVWFVGLNALTTAENQIINHFVNHKNARLIWDADSYYVNNDKHEAGLFLRQHFKLWGTQKLSRFYEDEKHIEVIGCAKNVGQTRAAGQLLETLGSSTDTAIVLADENLLFPVLNNLPQSVEAVNITMGAPISSTPLFSLVDILFQTHLRKIQYGQNKYHAQDLIKLFRHPYFSRMFNPDFLGKIQSFLRHKKVIFVSTTAIKKSLDNPQEWDVLGALLGDWSDPKLAIHSVKQLLDALKHRLLNEKASVESEILFAFYKSIQVLENHLLDFKSEMDLKTLRAIFFQIIGKESIAFTGEPLNGLQMMGVLETRTLDFKNLIMLSVNEEKLPAGKSVNSFIPYILKKYFKMPTHEERDAIFAYHFYRLLQCSERIYLLYNTQNDEFGSGERSRFITQLLNEYQAGTIQQRILHSEVTALTEVQPLEIPKSKEVQDLILQWASKRVSPTALSTFVNCKLQFYFKYIAKIRVENDLVEFMEANDFGSIIHDALFQAYLPHLDFELTREKLDSIEQDTLDFIAEGFEKEVGQRMHQGKNHLIWQVAKRLTSNYFDKERQCVQDSDEALKVLEVERSLEHQLEVDGVQFNVFGNVDRVDVIGDAVRIVDYKSGKVEQKDLTFKDFSELITDSKKAKAFQLMTYAYLYAKSNLKEDISFTAGNYSFRNLENGLILVKQDKTPLKINALVVQEFEKQLQLLLSTVLDEDTEFTPTKDIDACQWCDFKKVCGR